MSTFGHLCSGDRLCSHYTGFSASLAGALESAMYLILCQQMRKQSAMRFELIQLLPVHCIYLCLSAVCNLMTSLWYYLHEVGRTRLRHDNFPGQRQCHSFCQTLFKGWNEERGRGLYVEMTVQLIRVVLSSTKQEPMALTSWPIAWITRSNRPRCEGPRGCSSNPKGVYTVHRFYHGVMRILENCAVLAGGMLVPGCTVLNGVLVLCIIVCKFN